MGVSKGLLAVIASAAILGCIIAWYSQYQTDDVKPVFTVTEVTGVAENGNWSLPTVTP